jgi:hypothetical protein
MALSVSINNRGALLDDGWGMEQADVRCMYRCPVHRCPVHRCPVHEYIGALDTGRVQTSTATKEGGSSRLHPSTFKKQGSLAGTLLL